MAILNGVSKSRFPDFGDPNVGIGQFLDRAVNVGQSFLTQANDLFRNSFTEDGAEPVPAYSFIDPSYVNLKKPTRRRVYTQKPRATVLIKKRLFSTLRNNFDVRFMDEDERLFLRASKALFKRKCEEIAFYENLISLEGIKNGKGFLNIDSFIDEYLDYFFNMLDLGFGVTSALGVSPNALEIAVGSIFGGPGGALLPAVDFIKKIIKLREVSSRSRANKFTTWITDSHNYDFTGIGPGVGVIELNLVKSLSTKISSASGGGNCSMNIEDPYKLMLITESDIEIAVRSATSINSSLSQVMDQLGDLTYQRAKQLDQELNESRRLQSQSAVNFEYSRDGSPLPIGIIVETQEIFNAYTISSISDNQKFTLIDYVKVQQVLELLNVYREKLRAAANLTKSVVKDINPTRKRMRREFLGHSLIQHMDAVSVFMNSETRDDTPAYTGLPTEHQELLRNKFDSLSSKAMNEEWQTLAKDIMPFEIYQIIRNPSFWRSDGSAIFTGIITEVKTNYSADPASFILNITAKDNLEFLSISRFTKAPALTRPEGILEDPLTPFDLDVSEASGLLKTAPQLSAENNRRLRFLRFDDGPRTGEMVGGSNNLYTDRNELPGKTIMTFQHVPGLIYKWKHGIISAALNINSSNTPDGGGSDLNEALSLYGLSVQIDPFAGLDTADVISIMVTGQPYNYASFLENSVKSGTFSTDTESNSRFYLNYLFDFLERERHVYGDFLPAKAAIVDPKNVLDAFRSKQRIDGEIRKLSILQKQLADREDRERTLNQAPATEVAQADFTQDRDAITLLKTEIQKIDVKIKEIEAQTSLPDNLQIQVLGNEAILNVEEEGEYETIDKTLRYRLKKKPEDFRYNKDNNYFVVSEEYDQDVDIQAITRSLKDKPAELFGNQNSDYKTPLKQCQEVAENINFEFFADRNGNINFRPPQYNRTPLSLLIKMFRMQGGDGINILPEFLQELYQSDPKKPAFSSSRVGMTEGEIFILELKIFELLGLTGFWAAQFNIELSLELSLESGLWFINRDKLKKNAEDANLLTLTKALFVTGSGDDNRFVVFTPKAIATLRKQIGQQTGDLKLSNLNPEHDADLANIKSELDKFSNKNPNQQANYLAARDSILSLISQRQFALKIYKRLLDVESQLTEMTDVSASTEQPGLADIGQRISSWSTALLGGASAIPLMPKFMKKWVENDLSNDDGWASGKRFIINDDVVISATLDVNPPDFCRINVTGIPDLVGASNDGKEPGFYWAGATDFDLWRQFGHRVGQTVTRPDFSNAETQCAPYAVFKLLEQRAKLHKGSLTIMGNEHYEPGDVVFVNQRGLLYYVVGVNHTFDFTSGSFVTILDLEYGHPLGEYIPTPLDVIGKLTLSQRSQTFGNFRSVRNSSPVTQHVVPLETLFLRDYGSFRNADPLSRFNLLESFKKENAEKISNTIKIALSRLTSEAVNSASRVEVRGYYVDLADGTGESMKKASEAIGQTVINMLTTSPITGLLAESIPMNRIGRGSFPAMTPTGRSPYIIDISKDIIEVDKDMRRFPSAQAWAGSYSANVSAGDTPLPVNAIDVVFVQDSSRLGDINSEDKQELERRSRPKDGC